MSKATQYYLALLFFAITSIQAQVTVNINAPAWGPAGHNNATYYYLPDVQTYYDVGARQYVYLNGGKWVRQSRLPAAYSSYDLYSGYKVVFTTPEPYKHYHVHKVKYKKGYKGKAQKNIGSNGRGNGKVGHPGYKHHKGHHGKGNGKKNK